ncbi:Double-stranded RNA-binding domain [Sesbania bispinosa]|nr:Double-stranded RNA-binding domain [Sesbania bispinosa]
MHKNQLQESTVLVNGKEYKSRLTYPHRKEAEQEAAELALKSISDDIKNEECTILPDLMYCKSILNEYAVKRNLKIPQYITTQEGKLHPVFVSTLVFNGKSYTGKVGKSKKEAEQLAAFATVQSLLESNSCGYLHHIIKSKTKISEKLHQGTDNCCLLHACLEDCSMPVIDIPLSTVSICSWDQTNNKRKLSSVCVGSKKLPREDEAQKPKLIKGEVDASVAAQVVENGGAVSADPSSGPVRVSSMPYWWKNYMSY